MRKIYLALVCVASLSTMTACGGDKKADKANAAEGNTEEVMNEDEQNAEVQDAEAQDADGADVWGDPAKAEVLNLAALYEAGDFKPATTIIFEDTLGGETVGELPSKWDVARGSAEIGEAANCKYITMLGGDTELTPIVGDGSKNFLPEKYTLEFELMFGCDVWYWIHFFDAEEVECGNCHMWVGNAYWSFEKNDGEWIDGEKSELNELLNRNGWNHFAVSYDKGNLKVFVNGKRIGNLPNVKPAAYFVIKGQDADGKSHYIKNIRVAK